MLLKSTELNASMAMIAFAMLLAVPNINISLIGLDFNQFSSAVHVFTRLGFLLITINFLSNAAKAGGGQPAKSNLIVGGMLLIAAAIAYTSVPAQQIAVVNDYETTKHNYPYDSTWENNGTHQNTETNRSLLQIKNPSTNRQGKFILQNQNYSNQIKIKKITAEASEKTQNHTANLTLYTLDSKASVKEKQEFTIPTKSTVLKTNFSEKYQGYAFDIHLSTKDDTTPKIGSVNVEIEKTIKKEGEYTLKSLVTAILLMFGTTIALKG